MTDTKTTIDLLNSMKAMKVFDLEFPRFQGMPVYPPLAPGYLYSIHRQHQTSYNPGQTGPRTGASGLVIMSDHSGTHVDSLCHQAFEQKIHGGTAIGPDVQTPWGFKVLGAETIPPMIKRGVLLDVPASKGLDLLPEKYQITKEDMEGSLRMTGTEIMKDDVVLVRTGYGKLWNEPEKFKNYAAVSKDATAWLDDKGIFAVGVDQFSWDPPGVRDPVTKASSFAHINLIIERGIFIFENVFLEELSAAKCYHFVFLAFPLKMKGATGSPMRPVALG